MRSRCNSCDASLKVRCRFSLQLSDVSARVMNAVLIGSKAQLVHADSAATSSHSFVV
jgi:hypothetical protein